jgi:hypothetical protein
VYYNFGTNKNNIGISNTFDLVESSFLLPNIFYDEFHDRTIIKEK